MDDAPVRGLGVAGRVQPPLPLPARTGADGLERRLRPAHADGLRLRPPDGAGRNRANRRADKQPRRHGSAVRRHTARPRQRLHDHQRHRVHPLGAVHRGRAQAGRRPQSAQRHNPERHSQGIHRARDVHLPAAPVHAAGDGHVRILRPKRAALEHNQHQRLPHGGGGRDSRAGIGVHILQRHRLRSGGGGRRGWKWTVSRRA